ncbi:MAG: NusG domain II-containing protein [Pseudobutyrivibrio sp.]|nr:NusG domain II-containing protein [Pseudobutyrivibrio sp.]
MKKNDVYLIIIILLVTAVAVVAMQFRQHKDTNTSPTAVVTVDGEVYGTYPLNEDRTERIELEDGSYNILSIHDGYAEIIEASCPDQICVNHMHIHYKGETIVCLPNRVVVEIINGEESDIDGATH